MTIMKTDFESDLTAGTEAIVAKQSTLFGQRSLLVGLSGIDGSGKGYAAAVLAAKLADRGIRVANINVDGWLNLPSTRFSSVNPGKHFYDHALRLDEMFEQLVLPLRARRSHRLEMDFVTETATRYVKRLVQFDDIDVIILEGIFLFKPAYRGHFDLRLWIECSFEKALERALARNQEGLSPADTVRAYNNIYFPAQRIQLTRDNPRASADLLIVNDERKFCHLNEYARR